MKLLWRGRWQHPETLSHYIQELMASNLLSLLSKKELENVSRLAKLLPDILHAYTVPREVLLQWAVLTVQLGDKGQ